MMKTLNSRILYLSVIVTTMFLVISCNKEWDNHYKNEQSGIAAMSIIEYIQTQPDLSTFKTMLQISGYDSLLDKSQSFTVWAPDNNALKDIDLNDVSRIKDIVKNHITQLQYSTSIIRLGPKYVKTINGKAILFSFDGDGFKYGNTMITGTDVLANNGIVHVINGYLPFQSNIYEFIQRNPGFSAFHNYLHLFKDSTLNSGSSYDSTYTYSNILFDEIGYIDKETTDEDSMYTMILPTDTAWENAYMNIKKYFVSAHQTKAGIIQDMYTKYAITKNLVFKKRILDPFSLDSLVSTYGTTFKTPGYLFTNSQRHEVSNGLVYVTDTFRYKPDSWSGTIKLQAENTRYGRFSSNANILNRYYFNSDIPVSNNQYIIVEPTTTSSFSTVYVEFPVPNTLSTKYNIYCVFVPTFVEDTTDLRPFRALFFITYMNSSGIMVKKQKLNVTNNVTNPRDTTKMLIASNFTFPFSHISSEEKSDEIVKIMVQNDVKAGVSFEKTHSRYMRIDCIIMEPITE